jgi:Carboxyl transferase domain/Malonate decarboxylase gamma subunit (MdcE)
MDMLSAFKDAVQFQPQGDAVANLMIGKGTVDAKPCYVAIIENRIASGAIGVVECDKLASLFKVIAAQRAPLMLFIDSAGARVNEGLPALGAFRRMYKAAVAASAIGAPMTAVLGSHCYGGASMLAALCSVRYFNTHTRLAMSGPSILAAAAGASTLDESFRAIADISIGQQGRIKLDTQNRANRVFAPPLQFVESGGPLALHESLAARVKVTSMVNENVTRKDLTLLYPEGYALVETDGLVHGKGRDAEGKVRVLGSIDRRPMTAARAYGLAQRVWEYVQAEKPPQRLHLLIDCDAHSASLDDEKVMLSMYLANLAIALGALRSRETRIETIVLGKLGGGVYVALAAPSHEVNLIYNVGEIQLLPGKAITAILGDVAAAKPTFDEYVKAGVADRELKIGFVV